MDKYNIKHLTIAPFFAQSNGAAENAVKNIKNSLKNCLGRNKTLDLQVALNNFLFDYRNTQHATTGVSPATLMFGRDLKTRFSFLKPNLNEVRERVNKKQQIQMKNHGGKDNTHFNIGDKVLVKDYREINKFTWIPGFIEKIIGKCTYIVKIPELNKSWKRHTNQIQKTKVQSSLPDMEVPTKNSDNDVTELRDEPKDPIGIRSEKPTVSFDSPSTSPSSRPKRNVKPPERLVY